MKKLMLALALVLLGATATGCTPPQDGGSTEKSTVSDYFPATENTRYSYMGEGNEYASYTVHTDYTYKDRIQYRKDNGGTIMAEVMELDRETGMAKIYSRGEFYYREDFLRNESLMWGDRGEEEILLKEPIETGNSWTLEDGRKREITGVDVEVKVPYGDFKALEVTTTGDEYENVDYYVKELGLVKSVFRAEGHEISSSLESVEKDMPYVQNINFYYPNLDENRYYYMNTEVEFRTNDITRKRLETVYIEKSGIDLESRGLGAVFTENTEINYMYLGEDRAVYIDLNRAFVDEVNAGAQYESMILQSIANTFGGYYGVERVYLTIDGGDYESGHIVLKKGEYLKVNTENAVEIEKDPSES